MTDTVPTWQIIILIVCGLASVINILVGIIFWGQVKRIDNHSYDLKDHRERLIKLEERYAHDGETDKSRDRLIQDSLTSINTKIGEQGRDFYDIKDKLNGFILSYEKDKVDMLKQMLREKTQT